MRRKKFQGIYTNQSVKDCGGCCFTYSRYSQRTHKIGFGKKANGAPEIYFNKVLHNHISKGKRNNRFRWNYGIYKPIQKFKKTFEEDLLRFKYDCDFDFKFMLDVKI